MLLKLKSYLGIMLCEKILLACQYDELRLIRCMLCDLNNNLENRIGVGGEEFEIGIKLNLNKIEAHAAENFFNLFVKITHFMPQFWKFK